MESTIILLGSLTRLLCTLGVIILFFLFVVRPLFNYLVVNREIEQRKRESKALTEDEPVEFSGEDSAASAIDNAPRGLDDDEEALAPARGQGLSDREALGRLAGSTPDKAGDLIKKWVHSE